MGKGPLGWRMRCYGQPLWLSLWPGLRQKRSPGLVHRLPPKGPLMARR
jgi:hypothetical protein